MDDNGYRVNISRSPDETAAAWTRCSLLELADISTVAESLNNELVTSTSLSDVQSSSSSPSSSSSSSYIYIFQG